MSSWLMWLFVMQGLWRPCSCCGATRVRKSGWESCPQQRQEHYWTSKAVQRRNCKDSRLQMCWLLVWGWPAAATTAAAPALAQPVHQKHPKTAYRKVVQKQRFLLKKHGSLHDIACQNPIWICPNHGDYSPSFLASRATEDTSTSADSTQQIWPVLWKGPWKICACDVGRSPEAKWPASGVSKICHVWLVGLSKV